MNRNNLFSKRVIIGSIVATGIVIAGIAVVFHSTNTPSAPGATEGSPCTTWDIQWRETETPDCTEDYVGLAIDEARAKAENADLWLKEVKVDDVWQVANDVGSPAVVVWIEEGVVTKAIFENVHTGEYREDGYASYE